MMDKERYIELAGKVADGTASENEIALYNSYYNAYQRKYPSWNQLDEQQRKDMLAETQNEIYHQLHEQTAKRQVTLWPRVIGVAAAVAAIVFGIWFYNTRHPEGDPSLSSRANAKDLNDIAPGRNTATIKIGNGEAITLSDKQTGVVVNTNQVTYNDGSTVGSLAPLGRDGEAREGITKTLTVSTPRGGTYQITLPDGSKVWLNAASRLTYTMPLNERGGVRHVELSGEAYFEVFRNKKQAFVVTTKNLTTTVLGTHFNISAYEDEQSAKATLLEGSVRVAPHRPSATSPRGGEGLQGGEAIVLKPNQQATLAANKTIKVKEIDVEEAIAWKNGYFKFNSTPLSLVMKQVERWYNVDVVFEKESLKTMVFEGSVSRYDKVSRLLKTLENTGAVKFRIEGRQIYVGN